MQIATDNLAPKRTRKPKAPAFAFAGYIHDGMTAKAELRGFTLTATIHTDDAAEAPWEREDGHGPVSDWRRAGDFIRPPKRPGELVLSTDGRAARFYDFAEACKIARRDGWGVAGGQRPGETARQYAARAVMADFEHLRDWTADRWGYVGVAVTVERAGVQLTGKYANALWGIESNSGADYFATVAADLAGEALAEARAKLAELKA